MTNLAPFGVYPVHSTGLEMPNAGGGLNAAMKSEPLELEIGDEIFVVYQATVTKVRFEEIDKKDGPAAGLRRVHIASAEVATFVDETLVAEAIKAQKLKNEAAADRAAGVQRIPGTGPEDELTVDHDDGLDYSDDDAVEIPHDADVVPITGG